MTAGEIGWDPAQLAGRQDGESLHRLALLNLMGLGVAYDPQRGLTLLRQAAEAGHLLATESLPLVSDASGGLDAWFRSPVPERHSDRPAVMIARNFLSPDVCDWLIARASQRMETARVYDPLTGEARVAPVRSNSAAAFDLADTDAVLTLVREKVSRLTGLPVVGMEPPQVLHYAPGQKFDWHVDYLSADEAGHRESLAQRGQRIATCLVWLNEDYEGGETAFEHGGLRFRGGKGDAILWANVLPDGQPDPLTRHAGLPPTSGEKWILSQWIRLMPARSSAARLTV